MADTWFVQGLSTKPWVAERILHNFSIYKLRGGISMKANFVSEKNSLAIAVDIMKTWHFVFLLKSSPLFPTYGPHWPATMFRFLQLMIFPSQEHTPVNYPRCHENGYNSQRKETQDHQYHLSNLSKEGQHTCSGDHPHSRPVLPAQPQAITHENQKIATEELVQTEFVRWIDITTYSTTWMQIIRNSKVMCQVCNLVNSHRQLHYHP